MATIETHLKVSVDTSDLERAKAELDLVSRKDVQRMIDAAFASYDEAEACRQVERTERRGY